MSNQKLMEELSEHKNNTNNGLSLNMLNNALPLNWKMVRLEEVATYINGYPFKPSDWKTEGLPIIRIQNLNDPTKPYNYFSGKLPKKYQVHAGDILISWSASLGTYMWGGADAWLNQHIFKANVKEDKIYRDFFYWAMNREIEHIAAEQTFGSTMKHVVLKAFLNSQIPLPPFSQQRAIALVLQTVRGAIKVLQEELELEYEHKAALMEYLFTCGTQDETLKQTEIGEMPESWQIFRLEDIAQVAYGLTVNQARRKSTQLTPYLTVANVTRGNLRLDEVKQIGMLEGDADRYRLQRGDVLLIEGNGNPALLGSAAVWNDELHFSLHQNHLIRARPDLNKVLPNWLMDYLNSYNGRAQLLGRAKTSSGLHSINSRLVANLYIPLPSLLEQRVAVEAMQACNLKIASLEQETSLLEELFSSLLEELMTGRLSTLPLIEGEESHE